MEKKERKKKPKGVVVTGERGREEEIMLQYRRIYTVHWRQNRQRQKSERIRVCNSISCSSSSCTTYYLQTLSLSPSHHHLVQQSFKWDTQICMQVSLVWSSGRSSSAGARISVLDRSCCCCCRCPKTMHRLCPLATMHQVMISGHWENTKSTHRE